MKEKAFFLIGISARATLGGMPDLDYPLLLEPVYKDYIWGGSRLDVLYGRNSGLTPCAESWEVSDRPEGMSRVINGSLKGTTLSELLRVHGSELLGSGADASVFPLLIKLIDAERKLSVQVHPDDKTAERTGGEAKTEMWIILASTPDACVYLGLKEGVDEQTFRAALADGTAAELLNRVSVKEGDAMYVPGGTMHAIGSGCLILEVQQNSNTTYRVYDWDRLGHDGKPRELHVEQAMKVTRWDGGESGVIAAGEGERLDDQAERIVSTPYFTVDRLRLSASRKIQNDGRSFHALYAVDSAVEIRCPQGSCRLERGRTCLIPACISEYEICADSGTLYRVSASA